MGEMATKIYAPVNSVNQHKTYHTVLPKDIILTTEEANQLIELEKAHENGWTPNLINNRIVNISTTKNQGVHFFCMEKQFSLRTLAINPNLSPVTVFLMLHQIDAKKMGYTDSFLLQFLRNPVVVKDATLFKMVFSKLKEQYPRNVFDFMLTHLDSMCVANVMLVLSEAGVAEDTVRSVYYKKAMLREDELKGYIDASMPEVSGLPLNWVLRMYGIEK